MKKYIFNDVSVPNTQTSQVYRISSSGVAYGAVNVATAFRPESFVDNHNSFTTTPFSIVDNTYHAFTVQLSPSILGLVTGGGSLGTAQNFSGVSAGVYLGPGGSSGNGGMFVDVNGVITMLPNTPGVRWLEPEAVSDSGIVAGIDFQTGNVFTYKGGTLTETAIKGVPNNPPASGVESVAGVNNRGDIIGTIYDNSGSTTHAFLETHDGKYTQLPDIPNATWKSVSAINNSDVIVGSFSDGIKTHGFLYDHGKLSQIDAPNSDNTYVDAINNSGEIGGLYYAVTAANPNGNPHGFVADNHAPSIGTLIGVARDVSIPTLGLHV